MVDLDVRAYPQEEIMHLRARASASVACLQALDSPEEDLAFLDHRGVL